MSLFSFCAVLFFGFSFASDISFVDAKFCNDKNLSDEINEITLPTQNNNLCVNFTNISSTGIYLDANFINAVVTSDSIKNRACSNMTQEPSWFGTFVLDKDRAKNFLVPAQSTVKKIFTVVFPVWYQWFSYGCLTYQLAWSARSDDTSMLNIIVRKAKFISYYVWDAPIDNSVFLDNIYHQVNASGFLALGFSLSNQWNISQSIVVSGTISNMLWYHRSFTWPLYDITALQKKYFTTKDLENQVDVPSYGWLYKVSLTILHKPNITFDLRTKNQKVLAPWFIYASFSLVVWSWQIWLFLFFVLVVCILVWNMFRSLLKKKPPVKGGV